MRSASAFLLLVQFCGCGAAPSAACDPGSLNPCECPFGTLGVQACAQDGTHFGACTDCEGAPVGTDAIVKACTIQLSCLSPPPIASGSSCVSVVEDLLATGMTDYPSAEDLRRFVDCSAIANDCQAALNCASQAHGPSWCDSHSSRSCDGDVLITCLSGWGLFQQDCTQIGEHCREANGSASCTDGEVCTGTGFPSPTCGPQNRLVGCDMFTGLESSVECSTFFAGAGGSRCDPSAGACVSPLGADCQQHCEGDVAFFCNGYPMDCTLFGAHCALENGIVSCSPDATDCDYMSPTRCNGEILEMCADGRYQGVNCTTLGFAGCTVTGGAARCSG